MDESNTPPTKGNSTAALWVILAVVIVIVLGALYYYMHKTEPSTNSNVVVNTNTAVSQNTNTPSNTNTTNNTNSNLNINTASGDALETFQSNDYGLQITYPSDWQIFEQEQFCTKLPPTECTNELVSFAIPSGSKSSMAINYLGDNPNNLSINEWNREVEGRNYDLDNEVPMGDFTGYSSEPVDSNQYQSTVAIYFALGDKVFDVYWYDQEKRDEAGFAAFISTLSNFNKI